MVTNDRPGQKKIQCWIPIELWDKVEALNIPNQTIAVTHALELLVSESLNNPNESHDIPRLEATIEGLQMLLQEKNERINDLKREADTLGVFAHYFKSLEYKRLETNTEEREIVSQVKEKKPAREPRKVRAGNKEKALTRKTCKNCGEEFETFNPKKETCSDKCRIAFSRRKK